MNEKIKTWWFSTSFVFLWRLLFCKSWWKKNLLIDIWKTVDFDIADLFPGLSLHGVTLIIFDLINKKLKCKPQFYRYRFVANPGTGFVSKYPYEYLVSTRNSRKRKTAPVHVTVDHYEKYKLRDEMEIVQLWWLPNPLIKFESGKPEQIGFDKIAEWKGVQKKYNE